MLAVVLFKIFFSSRVLHENINIKIYTNEIMHVFYMIAKFCVSLSEQDRGLGMLRKTSGAVRGG
jgi:wobble nucleotide-excising tRNase